MNGPFLLLGERLLFLLVGSPIDGLRLEGPFADEDARGAYADTLKESWWFINSEPPAS